MKVYCTSSYDLSNANKKDLTSGDEVCLESDLISAKVSIPSMKKVDGLCIQMEVEFKKEYNGAEVLFGNDFDSPIRDILPYGFSWAMALFKRLVDPSVDGDVYADKPYLYGPAICSMTSMKVVEEGSTGGSEVVEEEGSSAEESKTEESTEEEPKTEEPKTEELKTEEPKTEEPKANDPVSEQDTSSDSPTESYQNFKDPEAAQRRSKYLNEPLRTAYHFSPHKKYWFEFATPYLAINQEKQAVMLPGFSFDVTRITFDQPLRYTLKIKDGPVLLSIWFIREE